MTNPDHDPRLNDPAQPTYRSDTTRDRTTVVNSRGSGGNAGLLIAAVVAVLLIIAFFTFGGMNGDGSDVTVAPEGTSQETTATVPESDAAAPAAPADTGAAAPADTAPAAGTDTAPEAPAADAPAADEPATTQPTQPAQ